MNFRKEKIKSEKEVASKSPPLRPGPAPGIPASGSCRSGCGASREGRWRALDGVEVGRFSHPGRFRGVLQQGVEGYIHMGPACRGSVKREVVWIVLGVPRNITRGSGSSGEIMGEVHVSMESSSGWQAGVGLMN